MTVRTRFAPSPTGFIHLGNIRSALYPWAFAQSQKGVFILRIEDTDVERSSQEAVDVILEGMAWLGLDHDEGPFYQMQRMPRYKEVLEQMKAQGLAYPCYVSVAELDALREKQMAAKEKPRYDGTWRPEPGKTLPPVPEGVQPVLRFRNPVSGSVAWDDKVKGRIEISNDELDDLVIARPAANGEAVGTPTYNFCVVVDDMDMKITHVIRGDDHVNNTPRQINIFRALGQEPPVYAHLPTVLQEVVDADGSTRVEKMSKRHGAKPVTQYRDEGYLADGVVNYLARLGWSHGDDEVFSREQFVDWFNLDHLGKSAAQFDDAKLRWVNAQHIKQTDDARLVSLLQSVRPELVEGRDLAHLARITALVKDRCDTLLVLGEWIEKFFHPVKPDPAEVAKHITEGVRPALSMLAKMLETCEWEKAAITECIKEVLRATGLRMPQVAMPVRVLVMGTAQTPSLDAVLALSDRASVLQRLNSAG